MTLSTEQTTGTRGPRIGSCVFAVHENGPDVTHYPRGGHVFDITRTADPETGEVTTWFHYVHFPDGKPRVGALKVSDVGEVQDPQPIFLCSTRRRLLAEIGRGTKRGGFTPNEQRLYDIEKALARAEL